MNILQICPPHLSDVECRYVTLGNSKSCFQQYYLCYVRRKQTVVHLPTPRENVATITCKLQNFFIRLKVCCVLSNIGGSEKESVVGCRRWFWEQPVVMCGNWNVRQAMSQQVFRVTTFCINTCFQSFSTLINRTVHHAVLKFSPCRNKPLPQAVTCPYQYTRSSCSVPQTQY